MDKAVTLPLPEVRTVVEIAEVFAIQHPKTVGSKGIDAIQLVRREIDQVERMGKEARRGRTAAQDKA